MRPGRRRRSANTGSAFLPFFRSTSGYGAAAFKPLVINDNGEAHLAPPLTLSTCPGMKARVGYMHQRYWLVHARSGKLPDERKDVIGVKARRQAAQLVGEGVVAFVGPL